MSDDDVSVAGRPTASWDEPVVLADRLALRAGVALAVGPALCDRARSVDAPVGDLAAAPAGAVLLLDATELSGVPDDRLAAAAAVVVAGQDPAGGTSAGLTALAEQVEQAGGAVALRTLFHRTAPDGLRVALPLVAATWRDPEPLRALLAAGPHSLSLDPHAGPAGSAEPARVCVVSFELAGMTGGGIGTASTALALSLARSGHDVTLLFTGWEERDAPADRDRWRAHYAAQGVQVVFLREPDTLVVRTPYYTAGTAYEVYRWLIRTDDFDVVHVPENLGHGAYAQLAKRQGAAFAATTFVVGTHGPTRWAAEANRHALANEDLTVRDAFERASVALADVLLGPSVYLHDYLRDRGWTLPARVHVQPYALPDAVRDAGTERSAPDALPASDAVPEAPAPDALPTEIVFFGRLETRKGVAVLCDALDQLVDDPAVPAGLRVTFLGPAASVLGEPADAYVARRAAAWPWPWQLVSDLGQQDAAAYLRRPGVLAVMPSLVDNAPNTVSEAVALGVPLVASRSGGTGELVDAVQRDTYTYAADDARLGPPRVDEPRPPLDPGPLAVLLARRLTEPAGEGVRPPATAQAIDRAYDRWHRAVWAAGRAVEGERDATGERDTAGERNATDERDAAPLPSVAVCVLADGDEDALAAVLQALAGPAAERDAPIVVATRAGAAGAGAARVAALAGVTADLLVMLRTSEIPRPGLLDGFARAAQATGADVYACAVLDDGPLVAGASTRPDDPALQAFVPVFGPPAAGLSHPAFAAGPYAVRRTTLERAGGFAQDARSDDADHELLNRLAQAGARIETIPEALAVATATDRWTALRTSWPHDRADPPYDAEQWLCVERPFRGPGGPERASDDVIGLLRGVREETARQLERDRDIHAQRLAEFTAWTSSLEETSAQLRQDRADLLEQNASLQDQLRTLRASVSWKVTRPIRAAQRRRTAGK